eukprot:scaffold127356_cov83-Cyclotella_meneghiniana.AAC.1
MPIYNDCGQAFDSDCGDTAKSPRVTDNHGLPSRAHSFASTFRTDYGQIVIPCAVNLMCVFGIVSLSLDLQLTGFLTSTKEGTEEKRLKISPLLPDRRHGRIDLFDLGSSFDNQPIKEKLCT